MMIAVQSILRAKNYQRRISSRLFLLCTICLCTSASELPSTLTGPPVASLVPPGNCQFGEKPIAVPLMQKTPVSSTSSVFRFACPDTSQPLNLSTCACLLAHADIRGERVTRPYTPISTNDNIGFFDLLVKNYGPNSKMSFHLHQMHVGEQLELRTLRPMSRFKRHLIAIISPCWWEVLALLP